MSSADLEEDQVEVEAAAVGLNFRVSPQQYLKSVRWPSSSLIESVCPTGFDDGHGYLLQWLKSCQPGT